MPALPAEPRDAVARHQGNPLAQGGQPQLRMNRDLSNCQPVPSGLARKSVSVSVAEPHAARVPYAA